MILSRRFLTEGGARLLSSVFKLPIALLASALLASACHGPPLTVAADSGSPVDASQVLDSATTVAIDATSLVDARASNADARVVDASAPDASAPDASAPDASMPDASMPDAGGPDAQVPTTTTAVSFTEITGMTYLGGRTSPDPWGVGSGAAVGDVDGDGDLDIFLSRCDSTDPPGGPSQMLRNDGVANGFATFTPVNWVPPILSCAHGAAFGDYDRDGDLDLFVTMNGRDRLYRNDGVGLLGGFVDVTVTANVAGMSDDSNSGAYFADVNHDGLLDLYVLGQLSQPTPAPHPRDANRLYLNRGGDMFEDVSASAGAAGAGSAQAAAFADLDNDGEIEIYVANDQFAINGVGGAQALDPDHWLDPVAFDDRGVPTYIDRSAAYRTNGNRSSMGVAIHDVDGDGRDEIFVSDWGKNHLQVWHEPTGRYYNDADAWGLALTHAGTGDYQISWQAEFTDFDRDGRDEMMLINGSVYDPVVCTSWAQLDVFTSRHDTLDLFVDVTSSVGWPTMPQCPPVDDYPISGRGVVLADLDGDGDDDVLITPYIEAYRFYRNDTLPVGTHHLRIYPHGTVSAPSPYGAVLVVTRPDGVVLRRTLYAGGTLAQRYPLLEVGLGGNTSVTEATLSWPSGYQQRLDLHPDFTLDATWNVSEPAWLTLSTRIVGSTASASVLTYRPVHPNGAFIGPSASGRTVTVTRSDGVVANVVDHGDGSYTAVLPHPGMARITVLTVIDSTVTLRPRLSVNYQ